MEGGADGAGGVWGLVIFCGGFDFFMGMGWVRDGEGGSTIDRDY